MMVCNLAYFQTFVNRQQQQILRNMPAR